MAAKSLVRFYKELSKHTGYEIEFDTLPEQNSNDRLNLIFSSGNIDYDYIRIGSGDVERSLFATYASRGLLEDLTDKIPGYDKLSQIDSRGFEALSQNGSVYGIPSTGLPYASSTNAIRMDWLEKVEMEVPTTPDELYAVLKAFKEKDPDGLGENNIPYTAVPQTVDGAISAGFGLLFNYEERDGKIVDARLLPEYKEYLTFMNKLYSEGFLSSKDFLSPRQSRRLFLLKPQSKGPDKRGPFSLPSYPSLTLPVSVCPSIFVCIC